MTAKLHMAPDLVLPIEAVVQTFAVLAKRGSGKSYLASVMAEEMLKARQQIVVLDPTGGWYGLRSSADGKSVGFPVVVFGGEHADVKLEESAGEVIAGALVAHRFPAVIDLSIFRKAEAVRFATAFCETLYRLNREPVHLFVDEADAFAPQERRGGGKRGSEAPLLGAMEDLVRRGRKRGIGCTLISQRPAVLHKSVLTQCESLFVLKMVHPLDIGAIGTWVDVHSEPAEAKRVIDSLPTLPIGDAWFWSPAWMGVLQRVSIRRRETFDSSSTPLPNKAVLQPKERAAIDLNKLGAEIKATVERAKAEDPKELRRRIADLELAVKAAEQRTATPAAAVPPRVVEVQVLHADATADLRQTAADLRAAAELADRRAGEILGTLDRAIASIEAARRLSAAPSPARAARARQAPPVRTATTRQAAGDGAGSIGKSGLRRILIALAQRQGLTNRQIGVRAGISSKSGTFSTYLSRARTQGWINDQGDRRFITDAGREALGAFEPLPSGHALLDYWLAQLGQSGAARILRVLAAIYPAGLSSTEVGERAQISSDGGTFSTYLSRLRTLELVTGGRGELRASEELFGCTREERDVSPEEGATS